jgi:hypothetical protein
MFVKISTCICQLFEFVEKDCLSDPAQTRQHLTPAVAAKQHALERNVHCSYFGISTNQSRRPRAGAWTVWVSDWVHSPVYTEIS